MLDAIGPAHNGLVLIIGISGSGSWRSLLFAKNMMFVFLSTVMSDMDGRGSPLLIDVFSGISGAE